MTTTPALDTSSVPSATMADPTAGLATYSGASLPTGDMFASANPALQNYTAAAQQAAQLSAGATTLPDLLRQALNAKLVNSPLVSERSNAAGNFLTALGNAPEQVTKEGTGGVILTPTQQASLMSGYRGSALIPLLQANTRLDTMTGTIGDIIGQAGNVAKAQAGYAGSQAEIAGKLYSDLIDRLYKSGSLGLQSQALALQTAQFQNSPEMLQRRTLVSELSGKTQDLVTLQNLLKTGDIHPSPEKLASYNLASTLGLGGVANLISGGGLTADEAKFYSLLSKTSAGMFSVGGQALPADAQARMSNAIPTGAESTDLIQQKINNLKTEMMRQYQGTLFPTSTSAIGSAAGLIGGTTSEDPNFTPTTTQ